jgi:hypothetical protein
VELDELVHTKTSVVCQQVQRQQIELATALSGSLSIHLGVKKKEKKMSSVNFFASFINFN